MKRPPGLWLLLSAGVLCLSLHDTYGLRATELIFGKTSTTSSTEKVSGDEQGKDVIPTELPETSSSEPKSNLTGNPQLDYIFDPNLPRELNGYNLSSYPFYNGMPTDIDFKCDGLHDGFYASVPHKCQVYHHCLFGTRFDFLCANYTAFDQKTFICHFVSEVDCNNSRDYWHRNDALYETASTTTTVRTTVATATRISPTLTDTSRVPPQTSRRRRPSRRRPAYEYYDEDYDEDTGDDYYEEPPPRRRRKRPRPRPRPYLDDYDDYEDDRYDRRTSGRRTDDGRNNDERRFLDDDRKYHDSKSTDTRRPLDTDRYDRRESNRKPQDRNQPNERRETDYDKKEYDDRRPNVNNRKIYNRRIPENRKPYDRREHDDRYRDDYDDRVRYDRDDSEYRYDRDRRKENERKRRPASGEEDPKGYDDSRYDRHRNHQRRPYYDDLYDEDKQSSRRTSNRSRGTPQQDEKDSQNNTKPLVKPNSGSSIYNQPRMPPRIKPPVPKNEQNKFSQKPTTERALSKLPLPDGSDGDDYRDYEDELLPQGPITKQNRKPETEINVTKRPNLERDEKKATRRSVGSGTRPRIQMFRRPVTENTETYEGGRVTHTYKAKQELDNKDSRLNLSNQNQKILENSSFVSQEPLLDKERGTNQPVPKFLPRERARNEFKNKNRVESTTTVRSTTTRIITTTASSITPTIRERPEPIVRVVKRPFLPSRGGNPYSSRGLQPVGVKALETPKSSRDQKEENVRNREDLDREISLNERRLVSKEYIDSKQDYKTNLPITTTEEIDAEDEPVTMQNARQFPSKPRDDSSFLINGQYINDNYNPKPSSIDTYSTLSQEAEEKRTFKSSPTLIKVSDGLKYSISLPSENNEEFKPKIPQTMLKQNKLKGYQDSENSHAHNIERNPLDIDEDEYDVTLNDALNPTIPNLPVRNFPPGFSSSNDYTYNTFQRPRYDITLSQASEGRYQVRSPSQRVETVAQPYYNTAGKRYITTGNYNTPPEQEQIYQNYRSTSQITQAETHPFYSLY